MSALSIYHAYKEAGSGSAHKKREESLKGGDGDPLLH